MKDEKYWSDKFNKLPIEIRNIACASSAYENINYLVREKQRLKKRYNQSVKEINEHIKNIEKWIKNNYV